MNEQAEPVRKSSLPCTPPPEYEFHTVMGARPDGMDGCMLMPGDMGPRVIRRRVSYGDWEPVSPDHWAGEPEPRDAASEWIVGEAARVTEPTDTNPIADALAAELHRRAVRLEDFKPFKQPTCLNCPAVQVHGEVIGLLGALGISLGGTVPGGTADELGQQYYRAWLDRQEKGVHRGEQ